MKAIRYVAVYDPPVPPLRFVHCPCCHRDLRQSSCVIGSIDTTQAGKLLVEVLCPHDPVVEVHDCSACEGAEPGPQD